MRYPTCGPLFIIPKRYLFGDGPDGASEPFSGGKDPGQGGINEHGHDDDNRIVWMTRVTHRRRRMIIELTHVLCSRRPNSREHQHNVDKSYPSDCKGTDGEIPASQSERPRYKSIAPCRDTEEDGRSIRCVKPDN